MIMVYCYLMRLIFIELKFLRTIKLSRLKLKLYGLCQWFSFYGWEVIVQRNLKFKLLSFSSHSLQIRGRFSVTYLDFGFQVW